jgi:fibronectin-binding autotransporter adhesin
MVRRTTRIGAEFGGSARSLARRGFGKSVAFVGGMALVCALILSTAPASAQLSGIGTDVQVAGTAVTGNTSLSGTLNGNSGAGYFVANGGTLTVNNGSFQDFVATGGSGSGGGLGAGGAIFIDTGGKVVLNNVDFSHNAAIGGLGGTSSPYGGTLNGISSIPGAPTSPNGPNGVNGTTRVDNYISFGDGKGNGVSCAAPAPCAATNGGNATNGFGGIGGVGGPATNGWGTAPLLESNLNISIQKVASDVGKVTVDGIDLAAFLSVAVADYLATANPFEDPLALISGNFNLAKSILAGVKLANDTLGLAADVQAEINAQNALDNWATLASNGLAGNGGAGGTGGNGGKGSYAFGGGAGGQGGAYGLTAVGQQSLRLGVKLGKTADGAGGNGGAGGAGGFGGGGGAGGAGFGANQNGCGSQGCNSTSGTGGAGGAAGFGGGVGSKGGVTGHSDATGGGGGSAYGGAIFINTGGELTITGNATFSGDNTIGGGSLNGGVAGGTAGSDIFMMQGSKLTLQPGASAGNVVNVITFNGTIADNSKSSIGDPTVAGTAGYPNGGGAYLTVGAGLTIFNAPNTYSGQTVITGGDIVGGQLNGSANTPGAPDFSKTDGALQVVDGVGLPSVSNLNFSGPSRYTGGVIQIAGTALTNGVYAPTTFNRFVSPNPNPNGGGNPGGVQWTGSGGFAAFNAPLTVTLSAGTKLTWGQNGFVPVGYSLIFGSATSNQSVTFTNAIDIGTGTNAAGTSASILVANNGNKAGSLATMSGVISGSGDLSIGGGGFNGTLNLTAVNTYTGGTYVHSGTLMISGGGSIASSSGLFLDGTGVLDISQSTPTAGPGSASAIIPTLNGSGIVALGGQELQVNNGGTFDGSLVDGGAAGGSKGSLIVNGGLLTLLGTNTYTGDTTINAAGTLALAGTGSIALSSPVINNGIFDVSQVAGMVPIQTLAGNGQTRIGSNLLVITNGSTTYAGSINDGGIAGGTGGSVAVVGGVQTFTGVNTYTGDTLIAPIASGGSATLALKDGGSIATSSRVVVGAGGVLDISQTTTGASIKTLLGSGTVALGAKTLNITNASTIFDGAITDGGIAGSAATGGKLLLSGGTMTLSGTNTYTGTTTINAGTTLALIGNGSISQSSEVIDNGIFDISQSTVSATIKTLSGNGQALVGSKILIISNGSTTFAGSIKDGGIGGGTSGNLWVNGGTQTLSGTNTYTGVTQVAPLAPGGTATLALTGTGSIATSSEVFLATGGTFDISQTTAGASIKTLEGADGKVALGAQTLTITNGSTGFAGVISDGGIGGGVLGGFKVTGGTQTLAGVNTYTGDTTIDPAAGTATLALFGNGSIATSRKVAIGTGGTFDISQTVGAAITTLADTIAGAAGKVALGAQTLFVTNGSTTFSGVISDGGIGGGIGGNLAVTGGTQTLAGVNTYTGITAITPNPAGGSATLALVGNGSIEKSSQVFIAPNGTFDISGTNAGASITTLSGLGSVVLGNETLNITAGAAGADGSNPAGAYAGIISGAGGVAITGGHQELLGQNTYTGNTTVTNGAILSINNPASLGAASSTLVLNNGTLVVDASMTVPQAVTLLGAPPGTDLINLNKHNLNLSGAINGPGVLTVVNGGALTLSGTVGTTDPLGGIVLGPGVIFIATPSANAGLGTTPIVLVPQTGATSNLFTGSVHVVGTLNVVNDPTGAELIINPGDSLTGIGGVNAKVIISGGAFKAPGDGPGPIFASQSVVNLPGSTYTVQIDGALNSATNCTNFVIGCAGQYSTTVVTNNAATYTADGVIAPVLRGIPPAANNDYVAPVGSTYNIVSAPGGVLGSFSSIIQPPAGAGLAKGTRFDALYFNGEGSPTAGTSAIAYSQNAAGNPTAVNLWVTPESYQNLSYWGVTLAKNGSQVAFALDALRGPAGLKNNAFATWDFGKLFPQAPQNLPGIFNTLSGEVAADAKLVSFQMTNQFLNMMLDTSIAGRASGGTGPLAFAAEPEEQAASLDALAYAATGKARGAPPLTFQQRWSVWGAAFGQSLNASGDTTVGSSSISGRIYGGAGGLDYRWSPDTVTGVALAGGGTNYTVSQALGTGRSDAFAGGVYGSAHVGPAYVAAALSAANHWMKTDRTAFGGDHLQAEFNAQSYGGRLEGGWRVDVMPGLAVSPYLAGVAQSFTTPSYRETDLVGGGFGLQYKSNSATQVRGEAGAHVDSRLAVNDYTSLVLHATGAWAYQHVTNSALLATFQAAVAPGALPGAGVAFAVDGAVIPKSVGIGALGAELRFWNNWSVKADLRGEFGSGAQAYSGTGTVRYAW